MGERRLVSERQSVRQRKLNVTVFLLCLFISMTLFGATSSAPAQSQPVAQPGQAPVAPAPVQAPPPSPQPQPQMPPQPTEAAQPQPQGTPPVSQAPSEPQAPAAAAERKPVGPPPPAGPARGQFSFNFDDADIYSVIQTVFGDVLRVSYVVDPRVRGRVTFRSVAPVPRENVLPVLEVILRLNGIAVVEDAGLYRIIPLSDVAREPSQVGFGRDSKKVPTTGKALLQVTPGLKTAFATALQ